MRSNKMATFGPLQRLATYGLILGLTAATFFSAGVQGTQAADADSQQVRISAQDSSSKYLRLGLNKSMIVDLPRDAVDVLVSNPKIADAVMRTARRAYLIGMEVGMTNIFFFDAQGRQIAGVELQVERDLNVLARTIAQLVPGSQVTVEAINDNVILSGVVQRPTDADRAADIAARFVGKPEQVLSMVAVAGKEQVFLKVSVAEVRRTVLKQFGIDLASALTSGTITSAVVTENPFSVANKALSATAATLGYASGTDKVSGTLQALEQNGMLRILAEPTLSAISGESAKFLAGGEFPVPIGRDKDGNVQIQFKEFGVALAFTPVVMSAGRISVKVATEVSELTDENALVFSDVRVPGLKVRRADTTVELPSGGSLALAGLLQQDTRQIINGFPGLKDVPVLGTLFRSRDYQNNETELVVLVTPYLVDPTARSKLARPDENLYPASDPVTILLGRLNRIYGVAGARPEGRYNGQPGFIVK
ncbi:MAG: type II and III secretion system protein family protein [Rhodobiaceae bacterium]|nr:type II and III secretion system protein family protein [Rhodobiaceae bacterium]MCC0055142.1 type II and III secretion system protein family protein [Rhodobiaceae bacterium]